MLQASAPVSFKDRTTEFNAVVERLRSRSHVSSLSGRRSMRSSPRIGSPSKHLDSQNQFTRMAAEINRNLTNTAGKLEKLTRLAKRKTLFDDRPVEIGELTFIIKQDIAKLNQQIAMLQEHVKTQKQSSKQVAEHTNNVVVGLQSKLANTSMQFKNVLEIRSENMRASKDKQDQFLVSSTEHTPSNHYGQNETSSMQPRRRKVETARYSPSATQEDNSTLSLGIPMLSQQQLQEQQVAVLEQDRYIEHRSSAIESIESTIAELGSIFQQLATMVAEQRETVQRIDQNTNDIEMNVVGAQRELLRYYTNISSNRWLMIKIFATVVLFFLLFTIIT